MKNGPRALLSVAFPIRGLLSLSRRAVTPNASESRFNSWPRGPGVNASFKLVRNSIPLLHSSVVILRRQRMINAGRASQKKLRHRLARTIRQHILCLGNKFVKFAYQTLEDDPCSSALGQFNAERTDASYMNVRVWCELGKLQ